MNIDWSKAPEGATHYRASIKTFYKQDVRAYEWDTVEWRMISNDLGEFRWSSDLIERPVIEWTGEGLPPAGTTCETRSLAGGDWEACKVHYMGNKTAVLSLGGIDEFWITLSCQEFRPTITPEQIAAEEKAKAIKAIAEEFYGICMEIRLQMTEHVAELIALNLYSSGYRKQATP